ncbi:MAG: 4Fe-4S dicluster domain-containing protein [Deltaproteobacteria bacterium]|nr:4Fe-4S dicluster domain-containing protein [Deltaproteobacteria bacterium]
MPENPDRREFLRLMGASMALAGLGAGACTRQPTEKILPYSSQPEELTPGEPLLYATALTLGGFARGVLVESREGRPTRIDGNPLHPASLGATDAFAQAELLALYDPDRSQVVTYLAEIRGWSDFLGAARSVRARAKAGADLRILTETVTSPALAAQLEELLAELPRARWHAWEPVSRANVNNGARLAFGELVQAHYRIDRADVILSLDDDLFGCGAASVRHARDFASRRVPEQPGRMCRLYVAESTPTTTGAMADHRFSLAPTEVEDIARAVARGLGIEVAGPAPRSPLADAIARDLWRHRGRGLVAVGEPQPPAVHALGHAMNDALGSPGTTVVYTDPVEASPPDPVQSLRELVRDIEAGRVQTLLILGSNPVLSAPADLDFAAALRAVPLRIHHGLQVDETAELCHWHVPAAHALESWGDARAFDGTSSIVQPLIAPLYGGRSQHEVLAALSAHPERSGYEVVADYWRAKLGGGENAERRFRRALHDGLVEGTAASARTPRLRPDLSLAPDRAASAPRAEGGIELVFRPDPALFDGRFAANPWLQELPRPLTKLTWGNAAIVAQATAARLGVEDGDVVEIARAGRRVRAPVLLLPGQPPDVVTFHLGSGRRRAGRVGSGVGFDAYPLRTSDALWSATGARIRRTGARVPLARTQEHLTMEGRQPVRSGTVAGYLARPGFAAEAEPSPPPAHSLSAPFAYSGHAWAMTIDLSVCTGCSACVVACQAENNVPVVGKEQVLAGRAMHWLRVDTYVEGTAIHDQPIPCMHCEQAPCELVCPTEATVHGAEGLNDMVYNRCVGTRFCANNCPYKVRRFNFFHYSGAEPEIFALRRNPDVTVRTRGVMEKCTYCVQRIDRARIQAQILGRRVRDGEVTTACEAVCPTRAIVFGDANDPEARVARSRASPRNYALLASLGTRPRTTYLASIANPNPEIES